MNENELLFNILEQTKQINTGGGGGSALDWVNVTQAPYSATGDGVTDDSVAIQNAILTGKTVYFPNPSVAYKVVNLYPAVSGQNFICENYAYCKFIPGTTNANIWDLTLNQPTDPVSGSTGAYRYRFVNFRIQGTNNGSTGSHGSAFFANVGSFFGDDVNFENCIVSGMGSGWDIDGLGNCLFENCHAFNNNYGLIQGAATGNGMLGVGLEVSQNYLANFWIKSGTSWTLILNDSNYGGATSVWDSAIGIRVGDSANNLAATVQIIGGNFEAQTHNSGIAIQVETSSRVTHTNAVFKIQAGDPAPVVVKSLGFYNMRQVLASNTSGVVVQCEVGAIVTGDGALVLYGTNDAGGGVVAASGPWIIVFDNGVPSPSAATDGIQYNVIPRASLSPQPLSYYLIGLKQGSTHTLAKWPSDAATGLTRVVAQNIAMGQSGTNASVVTYTTPDDGQNHPFRVGAICDLYSYTSGTVTITATFTDEHGNSQTVTFYPPGSLTAAIGSVSYSPFPASHIWCSPNTAITVKATCSGGASMTFDAGGVIESLY